ncbi:replication endonuclease [Aquitalea pelogenes]|uniref:replication endonuclease n=1 Tax=Aquitalea pelogenes TaxID=1293573 RepID=UPI0035ADE921
MMQALMQGVLRHDDLRAIKYPLLPNASWLPDSQARHCFGHFPRHLARAIRRTWLAMRNDPSQRGPFWAAEDPRHAAANAWAAQLVALFPADALAMSASEMELVDFAKARAAEADRLLLDGADPARLEGFFQRYGLALPDGRTDDGIARRAACSLWWRRNLRRVNGRRVEALSISLGLVQRHRALYCSHDSVQRRQMQKRRNRALLEALTAINELGESFTLADVADMGMANPAIRRAELMVRIAGFEHIAVGLGYAGEFITLTAPSRFHPFRAKSGSKNPNYDGHSTPRDAAQYLGGVWGRIMAALDRAEIRIFGFRVAEPHHDGTPHYHGLFFMHPDHVAGFRRIVARYAVRECREELGLDYVQTKTEAHALARLRRQAGQAGTLTDIASTIQTEAGFWTKPGRGVWQQVSARVHFKAIDWSRGTAAGYIAKYISKNIDGARQDGHSVGEDYEAAEDAKGRDARLTAQRVDAWAATWGIRQFQQVGGPPVGVWRELRRFDYQQQGAEDVLMLAASAADTGNWRRFVEVMGGHEMRRADMPLQMAKDSKPATNRYGEPGQRRAFGVVEVSSGQLAVTRLHEWTIKRGETVLGRESAPWTGVNNSTELQIPANTAPEATLDDHLRWMEEISESDCRAAIRPVDDSYLPPAQLKERQDNERWRMANGEAVLRRIRQARDADLTSFMASVNAWVQESGIEAQQVRAATLQKLALKASQKRVAKRFAEVAAQPGVEQITAIKAAALGKPPRRERPNASRTWKAPGGSSKSIAEQLASHSAAAAQWTASMNHISRTGGRG